MPFRIAPSWARRVAAAALAFGFACAAHAMDAIEVGAIEHDPATTRSIGLALPVLAGDDDYDATARLFYRPSGVSAWSEALPLLRVRPETLGTEDPPQAFGLPIPGEGFAGGIVDLVPGTVYEIRLEVVDPDGGSTILFTTASTRALPPGEPSDPRPVAVASTADLQAALSNALPGDVIRLADGTYDGPLVLDRSGTAADPIVIRGETRDGVLVDAVGAPYGLDIGGSWVHVEEITVANSTWGARISAGNDVVIRRSRFLSVTTGIDARGGAHRDFYICDNVLEGGVVWPDLGSSTWDLEGIVITGQGHDVCHNTLSGFGDALGLSNNTSIPNISIDFYGNDVLWGGDDGIEMDFAHRNVRAVENRFTNTGMGISMQPVWGGPVLALRNVMFNMAFSPYKLNNDPSGPLILHNTSVRFFDPGTNGWTPRGGAALNQWGGYVANFRFLNNIAIGTTRPAHWSSEVVLGEVDWNGWAPDGLFQFFDTWSDFQDLVTSSPYEAHGRILSTPVFAAPYVTPADYTTFQPPFDATLDATSNAVDAALVLPNVNQGFTGAAPDLGARERDTPAPFYGARPDCDERNAAVWAEPGEVVNLLFAAGKRTLTWSAPIEPGAFLSALSYDVLRATTRGDFEHGAVCVGSGAPPATEAMDADEPPPGGAFFYAVRALDACPGGVGTLGTDSAGVERAAPSSCP